MKAENLDYEFMTTINAGIEQREADALEEESYAEVKNIMIVLAVILILLAFSLETPH